MDISDIYCSSVNGHLGCFHVLAIVNSAAMNIVVHVFLSVLVSSGCMPSSGIAGSYGSSMAPHSTLSWKIPWTEEPGRLQSMGSLRVGHDSVTYFHFSLSCIREGNGNPLQCSCLENPRDGGTWWAAIYGVAQSRTRLKQLSMAVLFLVF